MNIKRINFPDNQYNKESSVKKQIVLHHTVSGPGVDGDINWWKTTPARIATHYIIDRNGVIYQLFDDPYWGYHLGLKQSHFQKAGISYRNLDMQSIGIELDSWGPLKKAPDGKFYPVKWENGKYAADTKKAAVIYPYEYCSGSSYKGHQYYERYTDKQIYSLKELLRYLCAKHTIPPNYTNDIWSVYPKALKGEPGIFSHTSYRADKSDAHPQVELVNMLKSL